LGGLILKLEELMEAAGSALSSNKTVELKMNEEQYDSLSLHFQEIKDEIRFNWRITQVLMGIAILGTLLERLI
jgi:hypothetical protein